MKKAILLSSTFIALLAACTNQSTKTEQAASSDSTAFHSIDTNQLAAGTVFYQCPMDPEQVSDQPAKCPKCGMDLEKVVKQ
jgi:hypothetical protein